jgi:hypothetical protein
VLSLIINFLAMVIITWSLIYLGMWILEKIALMTGDDFFRVSTNFWLSSWKSWAITGALVLLFM